MKMLFVSFKYWISRICVLRDTCSATSSGRCALFCELIFVSALLVSCGPKVQSADELRTVQTARINAQLGIAYLEQHEVRLAKQKLLLALSQAPNTPETLYSMAYFFEATGDTARASSYYQKALSVAPYQGEAHNNYGTFLCRQGQYRPAIQHFLMAVNDTKYLNPADAFENAGKCALKMGARKYAKYYLHQAIERDPTRTSSILELAELNYQDGNQRQARQMLNRFLLISPPSKESIKLALNLEHKNTNPGKNAADKIKLAAATKNDNSNAAKLVSAKADALPHNTARG